MAPLTAPVGLSRRQHAALRVMIRNPGTIREVADRVGVNEKTIDRWLKSPVFAQALADAEWALFDEAIRIGAAEMADSLSMLAKAVSNEDAALRDRIRAAEVLISSVTRLHSHRATLRDVNESTGRSEEWIGAEDDSGNSDADDGDDEQEAD